MEYPLLFSFIIVRSSIALIFFALTDLLLIVLCCDSSKVTEGLSEEEPPTANTGTGSRSAAVSIMVIILFNILVDLNIFMIAVTLHL